MEQTKGLRFTVLTFITEARGDGATVDEIVRATGIARGRVIAETAWLLSIGKVRVSPMRRLDEQSRMTNV
ncbi:MAG: hypothetical protein LC793_21195, partial [Thermomicrobia bacterium]|nr:hypothetical protein [Thermomicrobia bacterium]